MIDLRISVELTFSTLLACVSGEKDLSAMKGVPLLSLALQSKNPALASPPTIERLDRGKIVFLSSIKSREVGPHIEPRVTLTDSLSWQKQCYTMFFHTHVTTWLGHQAKNTGPTRTMDYQV